MRVTAKPFLQFTYTDSYGNKSMRTVFTPIEIICSERHWLLSAHDVDADRRLTFALRDCDFSQTGSEHVTARLDRIEGMLTECQAILRRLISAEAMMPATHKFETPPPWAGKDQT